MSASTASAGGKGIMFVQVFSGKVIGEEALREAGERWERDLRPGAQGFLGSTGGITADGRFITLARFDSEAAARANSDRPEQGAWWSEVERCLTDVAFADSADVLTILGGGSDDARFVQVLRGRITDQAAFDALRQRLPDIERVEREQRPEILGMTMAVHPDDRITAAVYFTDEASAREGERRVPSAEAQELDDQLSAAATMEEFFDLTDPWLR